MVGGVAPQPREAIRLQFLAHRQGVDLRRTAAAPRGLHLLADAQQGLHVVAHLVGHHVGLGKITRGAVALAEVVEKGQVDVQLLVAGAIKGPHRRRREPAGRVDPAAEQHQRGLAIDPTLLPEHLPPGVLGIGQHHRDEIRQLLLLLAEFTAGLTRGSGTAAAQEQRQHVYAQQFAAEDRQHADHQDDPSGFGTDHGRQEAQ